MRRILFTLRTASLSDWLTAMVLALAFVGMVEAPWTAPHFVQENQHGN